MQPTRYVTPFTVFFQSAGPKPIEKGVDLHAALAGEDEVSVLVDDHGDAEEQQGADRPQDVQQD